MQSHPSPDIVEEYRSACEAALHKMFEQQQSFKYEKHVFMATRHGIDPKHGSWKVSFWFWVQGFKISRQSLPDFIKHHVPKFIGDEKGALGWDLSVYSSRRNMGIPGACKGAHGDHRVMQIATGTPDSDTLRNYIIQYWRGSEVELHASKGRGRPRNKAMPVQHPETVRDATQTHDCTGQLQSCEINADWEHVMEVLCEAGFVIPCRPKRRDNGYDFFADSNKGCTCLCCDRVHDSNNWYALFLGDGRLDVRNYSKNCSGAIFGEACKLLASQNQETGMDVSVMNHHVSSSLIQWGFKAEYIMESDGCIQVSQHMRRCPACRAAHASPSWIIGQIVRQCYSLRNSGESCREKLISQKNEALMLIKEDTLADAAFAELFIDEHRDRVLGSKNGKVIHMFDGTRWVRLEMREFD